MALVTEASTYETLVASVWQIAPERYVLNGYGDAQKNFCLDFHQMQEAREAMAINILLFRLLFNLALQPMLFSNKRVATGDCKKPIPYLKRCAKAHPMSYYPKFYQFLWKKGIALPPALLSGFFTNMLVFGLRYGTLLVLAIFFLVERNNWSFPGGLFYRWVIYGVVIGLGCAFDMRRTQKKLKLLSWQEVQNLPAMSNDDHHD